MSTVIIYHNPRCSKSRETLSLLQEKGIQPEIIEYMKTPPTVEELRALFDKLNISEVPQMMRSKEAEYKACGLNASNVTDTQRFEAMAEYPKLLERPIVVANNTARIGRPPEAVLDII